MSSKLLALPLLALALQAQIKAPQMGAVRCADGSVRPVYGVAATFVLGKPLASSAVALSFSSQGGIVATRSGVLLLDAAGKLMGQSNLADAQASVDMGSGASSAIAWLPKYSSLLTWNGSSFEQTVAAVPPAGRVTSLWRDSSAAYLLVVDAAGSVSEYGISLTSGEILSSRYLPGVTGNPLTVGELLLYQNETGVAIQSPAGSQSLPLTGAGLTMEKMGDEWVHVTTPDSSRSWALHLASDDLKLYELPGVSGLKEPR